MERGEATWFEDKRPKGRRQVDGDEATLLGVAELWELSCRLRAVGELIKFLAGEPAIDEDEVNYGIGSLLTGLADEVRALAPSR